MTTSEVGGRVLVGGRSFDPGSAVWVQELSPDCPAFEDACRRLHASLVKIATGEIRRRWPEGEPLGPELEDLADLVATGALSRITRGIGEFQGETRFRTWAVKFVVIEVSMKVVPHFWRERRVFPEHGGISEFRAAVGNEPLLRVQDGELRSALACALDNALTERQKGVFVAVALDGVPLDVVAERLGTTRNAIYDIMFTARRDLHVYLVANHFLEADARPAG